MWITLVLVLIGVVTLGITVGTIIYNIGKQAARLESVELWRLSVRQDLHEVSDVLEHLQIEVGRMAEEMRAVHATLDGHDRWERTGRLSGKDRA